MTSKISTRLSRLLSPTVLLFSMLLFNSCSNKISFQNSMIVPAAEGTVKVKKDKNSNYALELNIKRLADPKRLSPAKNLCVVWIETKESGTKNIGQLKTSSGMFSGKLKSSLKTVTAFEPLKIFITAEDEANILYARGQRVLQTKNF